MWIYSNYIIIIVIVYWLKYSKYAQNKIKKELIKTTREGGNKLNKLYQNVAQIN